MIVENVPTEEITEANWDTGPEERVTSESALTPIWTERALISNFSLKNDSHNDTIDGDGLTENDAA